MSFPAGVITRTVTLPPITDASGETEDGVWVVTPSFPLKWAATGAIVLDDPVATNIVAGTASVTLPVVQTGMVLSTGVRVDVWTYTASFSLSAGAEDIPDVVFILVDGVGDYILDYTLPQEIPQSVITHIEYDGTPGATGPANVLSIGSVTDGAVASATITGTSPAQVLNLVLQRGPAGAPGSAVGVPQFGTTGQYLKKNSGTDYDTSWATLPAIHNIPASGTTGQVLTKISGTDYDVQWSTPSGGSGTGLPNGGTAGQTLIKQSSTNGDAVWVAPSVGYGGLPAGTKLTVQKAGGVWPARPTSRADIFVAWKGPDPDPAIVTSGTGGARDGIDTREVTLT